MPDSRSFKELLDVLVDTPLGGEMRDPEQHRQRIYRELAEDDDPLLREIGEQLRDGVIRPHQLLDIPGYDVVVASRLEQLRQVDPEEVRKALANYVDSLEHSRKGQP